MEQRTVAFTGLRPQKLPFGNDEDHPGRIRLKELLRLYIVKSIEQKQALHFISGMAMGIDQICAQIVIDLKAQYPVTLEAAIPCINQAGMWPQKCQNEYNRLLTLCDERHYVSKESYIADCMKNRNAYMISKADYLLAVWDFKSAGGTKNTVACGLQKGIPVVIINPVTFAVKWGNGA